MIHKTRFRAVCFVMLGVFCWSAFIELTLSFGGRATFSVVSLLLSIIGTLCAVYALQHEEQWYEEKGDEKR